MSSTITRVVILGGGFGGAEAAKRLVKHGRGEVDVVLLDRHNYLTFYPLLVEAAVGGIEPRHVVVPLRSYARDGFRMGEILSVDLSGRSVRFQPAGVSEPNEIPFDHLVIGMGSVTRFPNIPGLAENAYELKSVADAIGIRDRAIALLEQANECRDPDKRKQLLTFIIVGGNFTGTELAGELQHFLLELVDGYPNLKKSDISVIVFEHGSRLLGAMSERASAWARATLRRRGVVVHLGSSVVEVLPDRVRTEAGEWVPAESTFWTAGIQPSPLLRQIEGLPLTDRGYIKTQADLRVEGYDNVWAVGDAASVPMPNGKPFAATAQNAVRQGPQVAKNILSSVVGKPLENFEYRSLGAFAVVGGYKAAADLFGFNVNGLIGWFMFRGAYLSKMPTFALKLRLLMDWFLDLFLRVPTVQIGVHRSRIPMPLLTGKAVEVSPVAPLGEKE